MTQKSFVGRRISKQEPICLGEVRNFAGDGLIPSPGNVELPLLGYTSWPRLMWLVAEHPLSGLLSLRTQHHEREGEDTSL
jgi:hypothetical protein